jgi:hypothetical protein
VNLRGWIISWLGSRRKHRDLLQIFHQIPGRKWLLLLGGNLQLHIPALGMNTGQDGDSVFIRESAFFSQAQIQGGIPCINQG